MEKSRVEEFVGEPVSEFSVSAGCKKGDGMAGTLKSIHVKAISGREHHLVLKERDLESPWGSGADEDNGSFKTENMVYSTLIPKLTEFAKARGVDPQIPVPKVYSTYKGPNALEDYICLDDLRLQGYKMTDKYAGLTLEEMLLVMTEIGHWHALTYALIKWEGEKIFASGPLSTLVQYYSVDTFSQDMSPMMIRFCGVIQRSLQIALRILEKRNDALYKRLQQFSEGSPDAATNPRIQLATGLATDLKYFPVITHGDAWQNNFLFKYDNDGKPISLCLLDFQFTRRGNIYDDLMYIVHTSTTPEFRRLNLLPVLQHYYESFSTRLKELKMHQPIGFTLGTFLDTFKENLPCAYRYMTFAIPLQLGTSIPEVMEMMQKQAPNGQVAPEANGVQPPPQKSPEEQSAMLAEIMRMQMETNERAVDRLEALTQEMVDLNVF